MKYFLDTEFDGDLISLALVCEDGQELYMCRDRIDRMAVNEWVRENVLPVIDAPGAHAAPLEPKWFGKIVADFLVGDPSPVIVADWPEDIAHFCRCLLTGPGMMLNIQRLRFELVRVYSYPTDLEGAVQHNALWDARALKHRIMGNAG